MTTDALDALNTPETPTLPDAGQIAGAAEVLRRGGLVAFPTETVYGLGANAEDPVALDRLYTVKGRPKGHPVIVHLASTRQLGDWANDIPKAAWRLAEAFWPGPLTLILQRTQRVPDAVTGGQETVGIRVPDHPVALQLLEAFGGGIAAPSANRFGRLSPTHAAHVQADLGDDVQMVLDGGACQVGVESTIVAFREGQPVILRPGMITAEQIAAVLNAKTNSSIDPEATKTGAGETSLNADVVPANQSVESTVIRAPGTLASHYAPHTRLRLISTEQLTQPQQFNLSQKLSVGILARQEKPAFLAEQSNLTWVRLADQPEVIARELYACLRELDQRGLDEIWVETVPEYGPWAAVADRLRRAAYQD